MLILKIHPTTLRCYIGDQHYSFHYPTLLINIYSDFSTEQFIYYILIFRIFFLFFKFLGFTYCILVLTQVFVLMIIKTLTFCIYFIFWQYYLIFFNIQDIYSTKWNRISAYSLQATTECGPERKAYRVQQLQKRFTCMKWLEKESQILIWKCNSSWLWN